MNELRLSSVYYTRGSPTTAINIRYGSVLLVHTSLKVTRKHNSNKISTLLRSVLQMSRMRWTSLQSLLGQSLQTIWNLAKLRPQFRIIDPTSKEQFLGEQTSFNQQSMAQMQLTLTSLDAWKLLASLLMPLPACQMITSGGWPENGQQPNNSSCQTVLEIKHE